MSDTHSMTDDTVVFVISDSAGDTATRLAQAVIAQYPGQDISLVRQTFVNKKDHLMQALQEAKAKNAMVLHTLVSKELVEITNDFCQKEQLFCIDILTPIIKELSKRTQVEPTYEPGALHHLNKNYFKRIKAMEFAVKYDDGKDPRGFLKADIVLLGVSRTSKTPLSLFLANKNLRVANLPLIPEAHIPEQLWQVNPDKIVGLMNDPDILISIRRERMKAYGLDPDTAYSDINKVKKELEFAQNLYDKLGCKVINVAQLSIEETASMILSEMHLEDHSYYN